MEALPTSSAEIKEILDRRMESFLQIYQFQKEVEEKELKDATVAFTKQLYQITQEIVRLQKRLLDALEWEAGN